MNEAETRAAFKTPRQDLTHRCLIGLTDLLTNDGLIGQ